MECYICPTCGTQYAPSEQPPAGCAICNDERQYVPLAGQTWTTLAEVRTSHRNHFKEEERGLTSIETDPKFGIGQRALLVQSGRANVLWDCIGLIDDSTISAIHERGGLTAMAISHPHYYTSMVEWSRAFRNIPIYLHEADRQWVMRPDPAIIFWNGRSREIAPGLTVIKCGGHFPGAAVLHWQAGADGRGVLLTGDTIQVIPDRRFVAFMYSFPNYIPLPPQRVDEIAEAVRPYAFDRIYGAWKDSTITHDAPRILQRSAERYRRFVGSQES